MYDHDPALIKAQNETNTVRTHNQQLDEQVQRLRSNNQQLATTQRALQTQLTATTARAVTAETATTKAEAALSPRALRKLRQQGA